jgi:hypothetical protein
MNNDNVEQQEMLALCKICNKKKKKIFAGYFGNDARCKKWIGESFVNEWGEVCEGRQWNGRMCPECHVQRVKIAISNKRDGILFKKDLVRHGMKDTTQDDTDGVVAEGKWGIRAKVRGAAKTYQNDMAKLETKFEQKDVEKAINTYIKEFMLQANKKLNEDLEQLQEDLLAKNENMVRRSLNEKQRKYFGKRK